MVSWSHSILCLLLCLLPGHSTWSSLFQLWRGKPRNSRLSFTEKHEGNPKKEGRSAQAEQRPDAQREQSDGRIISHSYPANSMYVNATICGRLHTLSNGQ